MWVLKTGSRQPLYSSSPSDHKHTIDHLVQKMIVFVWVKRDRKLRLWKELLYLEDNPEKTIYLKEKEKIK